MKSCEIPTVTLRDLGWLVAASLALAACAVAEPSPATANADGSMTIVVPADRVQQCKEQGGCGLFSVAEVAALVQEAGAERAKVMCLKSWRST